MSPRRNPPIVGQEGRALQRETRSRRRRRRIVRGAIRLVFWTLVLGGVFVFGVGLGTTIGGDDAGGSKDTHTILRHRGPVTATLPTRTVVTTKTVTKTVRVPAKKKKSA